MIITFTACLALGEWARGHLLSGFPFDLLGYSLTGNDQLMQLVAADVSLRALFGGQSGVDVPPGVVTALLGAGVMVCLARRHRDGGPARRPPGIRAAAHRPRAVFTLFVVAGTALLAGAVVLGMLLGDTFLRTGDVALWLQGRTSMGITFVLDQRYPRVLAAVLAGAALAVAGTIIQAVCRNPLAEPSVLGITSGAGVGAILDHLRSPRRPGELGRHRRGGAGRAGVVRAGLRPGVEGRAEPDRLVLMGFAVASAGTALTVLIIVETDPWNTATALTWLSGSDLRPHPAATGAGGDRAGGRGAAGGRAAQGARPALARRAHPRILGVPVEPARLTALAGAVVLTATAVSAIGVVGFVGPGRPARRPRPGGRPAHAGPAGRRAAGRAAGQPRRHPGPDGHRPRPDPRRTGHRHARHTVFRLAAVAVTSGTGVLTCTTRGTSSRCGSAASTG